MHIVREHSFVHIVRVNIHLCISLGEHSFVHIVRKHSFVHFICAYR